MKTLITLFWKIWNFWFSLSDKIRYVLVGGFNACVSYLLYAFLLWSLGEEHYQEALVLSWIISSFFSFTTQKIFVFCTKGNFSVWVKEYLKCAGVWVTSFIINAVVLDLLVRLAHINPYGAQIIAVACTTVTGYLLFKHFAFKH